MKLETKANLAIGLSVVALIFVAIMFVLWCGNVGGFSAVNLDTFVGVIVALLAIIVTIAIGWQIFNIYEVKSQIGEIKRLKTELGKQRLDFEDMELSTAHLHAISLSYIGIAKKEYCDAFHYLVEALYFSLQHPLMPNLESILLTMEEDCLSNINIGTMVDAEFYDKTIIKDKQIRKLQSYSYIKRRYNKIYNDYIRKVCANDDQN